MFGTRVGFCHGSLGGMRGLLSEAKCKKGCKMPKKKSKKAVKESTAAPGQVLQPLLMSLPTLAVIQPKYNIRLKK